MPRIKLSYIRLECEYRKPMTLLYKLYYMNIVFIDKTIIDSFIEQQQKTPIPQAIDRGQRKPLEAIFIVVVHLIFIF
jgi:hypothetical protein